MTRKTRGAGSVWALLVGLGLGLGAALAGCGEYQQEIETLCRARGTCVCDAGNCCLLAGEFCDQGQCCGGLTCGGPDMRCMPQAQ